MVEYAVHPENLGNWPVPGAGIGFDKLNLHMQAHCTYACKGQAEKQLIIITHKVNFHFKCVLLLSPNSKYYFKLAAKISQMNSMTKFKLEIQSTLFFLMVGTEKQKQT